MRKFLYSTPLGLISILLLAWVICYFSINACRKIDHQSNRPQVDYAERFLALRSDVHPAVKKVVERIRRMNKRREFLNEFVPRQGFAIWNKSVVTPVHAGNNTSSAGRLTDDDYCVLIPLVLENTEKVHGAIACKVVGDSVYFTLLDGSAYHTYNQDSLVKGMNGRQLSLTLMYLDEKTFGHTTFCINDTAAFRATDIIEYTQPEFDSISIHDGTNSSNRLFIFTLIICHIDWVPPHDGQLVGCPPDKPNCNDYVPIRNCDIFNIIGDDGFYDDDPPPGGYGGGEEGGGSGDDPCKVFPGTEGGCGSGGPTGWNPVDHQGDYNPEIYDTIGVSNYIRDSFPCLYHFLKDSFSDGNRIAQLSGVNLFHDSTMMHLKFEISDSLTQPGQASGKTYPGLVFVDSHNITQFVATIKFNPWYLKHGTKEYMVSTIAHELMHAVFTLRWGQYESWLTWHDTIYDSTYIKQHFPIYWYYYSGQPVPSTELSQHEMMALDYSTTHHDIVSQFFNPAASTAIRDTVIKAMAYCGLRQTTAWKLLPSQGVDTCKYAGIQISAENSSTGGIFPTGCSSSNAYHYANDLKMRPGCN